MAERKCFPALCSLIFLVISLISAAQGALQELSSCPAGQVCTKEKCINLEDGNKACCLCSSWKADGGCTETGWAEMSGGGKCTIRNSPMTGMHLTQCPNGQKCSMSKCKGSGTEETCCKCAAWDEMGECREDSWALVKGAGGCSVTPGDGSVTWIGQMSEQSHKGETGQLSNGNMEGASIVDHQGPKNVTTTTDAPTSVDSVQGPENKMGISSNSSEGGEQGPPPLIPITQAPLATTSSNDTAGTETSTAEPEPQISKSNSTEAVGSPVEAEDAAVSEPVVAQKEPSEAITTSPELSPTAPVSKEVPDTILDDQAVGPSNGTEISFIPASTNETQSPPIGPSMLDSDGSQSPGTIKAEIPSISTSACPVDGHCGNPKCQGTGAQQTCCVCSAWNEEGKCEPGKWVVDSGPGTCEFILADFEMLEQPVAIPKRGSAAPEEFIDLLPFTPCPKGVTCETTKCAIHDGVEACCDCWIWAVSGRCSNSGWKPRGKGDCSFAISS